MALTLASGWQPDRPSDRLASTKPLTRAWRRYLRSQGYAPEEDAPAVDGLTQRVSTEMDQRRPEDRTADARAGIVVEHLSSRPPASVMAVPTPPQRFLSPADFGQRLQLDGARNDLAGQAYNDVLTKLQWWVVRPSVEQGGAMVASGALYGLLGLAAPSWRVVTLLGKRALAVRALSNWHRLTTDPSDNEAITRSRAADVWLLFRGSRGRYRRRLNPIPGFPAVCRYDLRAAMGYDGGGRRDQAWGNKVEGAADLTVDDLPMLRRIDRLAGSKIRSAVRVADLPIDQGAELYGTLIARREILRAHLQRLTGG